MNHPFTGEWQRHVPVASGATELRLRPLYNAWANPAREVRLPAGPEDRLASSLRPVGTVDIGQQYDAESGSIRMTWTWTSDRVIVARALWADGPVYQAVVLEGLSRQRDRWWLMRGVFGRVKFCPLPTLTGLITNVWAFTPPGGECAMRWMRRPAVDADAAVYGGWERLNCPTCEPGRRCHAHRQAGLVEATSVGSPT